METSFLDSMRIKVASELVDTIFNSDFAFVPFEYNVSMKKINGFDDMIPINNITVGKHGDDLHSGKFHPMQFHFIRNIEQYDNFVFHMVLNSEDCKNINYIDNIKIFMKQKNSDVYTLFSNKHFDPEFLNKEPRTIEILYNLSIDVLSDN